MNIQRFNQIIDAYGGNSNHWPESERQTALAFLATSTRAQQLVQEANILDNLLDMATVNTPSPQLQQHILNAVLSKSDDIEPI